MAPIPLTCVWDGSHELIEAQLKDALRHNFNQHLLLCMPKPPPSPSPRVNPATMTKGVVVQKSEGQAKYRFVGCLHFNPEPAMADNGDTLSVTIGDTEDLPAVKQQNGALDVIHFVNDQNVPRGHSDEAGPDVPPNPSLPAWTDLHHKAWLGGLCQSQELKSLSDISMQRKYDALGQLPLHLAAERGVKAELLGHFLPESGRVNGLDLNLQTPLHRAAWGGFAETIEFLLSQKCHKPSPGQTEDKASKDRNEYKISQDRNGSTALHIAAFMGFEKVVEYLCGDKDIDIQVKGRNGLTALHYASIGGQYSIADILAKRGAIIDAKSHGTGWTSLHCAADNGHVSVVKLLLEKGANIEEKDERVGWTPLHFASMGGHRAVVEELLIKNKDQVSVEDKMGWTALHFAAINGYKSVVDVLMRANATTINTIFDWKPEASKNHDAVVEWFNKERANKVRADNETANNGTVHKETVNKGKDTFEENASFRSHLVAMNRRNAWTTLAMYKDLTTTSNKISEADSLMHAAAREGLNETLSFLVRAGYNVKKINKEGQAPLHLACMNGHTATVQWLVNQRLQLDTEDRNKWTPLHYAADGGHSTVVQLLIDGGAAVDAQDSDRHTPLHFATKGGHLRAVEMLVNEGAGINTPNEAGYTALHYAAQHGHLDVAKWLI